jgi:hypothetical protein
LLYMPVKIGQYLVDQKGHREYIGWHKRDIHEADFTHLSDAASAYLYVAQKHNRPIIQCAPDGELRTREAIHDDLWNIVSVSI